MHLRMPRVAAWTLKHLRIYSISQVNTLQGHDKCSSKYHLGVILSFACYHGSFQNMCCHLVHPNPAPMAGPAGLDDVEDSALTVVPSKKLMKE